MPIQASQVMSTSLFRITTPLKKSPKIGPYQKKTFFAPSTGSRDLESYQPVNFINNHLDHKNKLKVTLFVILQKNKSNNKYLFKN